MFNVSFASNYTGAARVLLFLHTPVLRSSLLLSSLISNSESWVGLTKKQVNDLKSVDEELFRNIFSNDQSKAHSKTPLELFYLETGSIPIRYILMSRRLNFLWYLIHQKEESLLSNFFLAQCEDPTKGDWVSQVKEDMKVLNIELTFESIKTYSKDAFKLLVKNQIRKAALAGLKEIQETHSKSKKMDYSELKMQEYLLPDNGMTNKEKSFAFSARVQMLDVKCNFKFGKSDLRCSLGCDSNEDQEHLLHCPALNNDDITAVPKYQDIFSNNHMKVKKVTQILMRKYTKFMKMKATVHGQSSQTKFSAAKSKDTVNDVDNLIVNVVNCLDLELE